MSRKLSLSLLGLLLTSMPAFGWHAEGHARAAHEAVSALPSDMPEFFRNGGGAIEQFSGDPDLFTKPLASPELAGAEAPEHYIDLELLEGQELPATRYEFLQMVFRKNIEPAKMGFVPYAIAEWTDRLAVAFAEYRKWPDDPATQQKILLYAGFLAHYAGDSCMPLHTTIHHDGKVEAGKSPKRGIHREVDALLGKLPMDASPHIDKGAITPADNLRDFIMAQIKQSHALVEPLYAMESQIPAYEDVLPAEGPVFDFTKERLQASAIFIARLYATAWARSKDISIPEWHHRPIVYPKVISHY